MGYDQAREKFVSVRKGTRAAVVTGLEEDLHNAKSAFQRCRFNLQSFDPIIEAHTGRDLIPKLVKGRRPKDGMPGQDYSGMYCAVLTLGSTVVSAALLRVMGGGVAELPLVATSSDFQGLGYFQALFSCIERMLISLKIEHFMLPAAQEAEAIWMKKFGFSKIPQEQLEAYLNGAHLTIFYGTSNLYKAVLYHSIDVEAFCSIDMPIRKICLLKLCCQLYIS